MKFKNSASKSWKVDHTYDDVPQEGKGYDNDDISTISGGSKPPAYADDPTSLVESPSEKKRRLRSHWVAYATMMVMTMGFSVVLSGVWPYLKNLDSDRDKSSLGWVVAANPLGQMIASPFAGYLGNRLGGIRWVCYGTVSLFVFGNLLYSILPVFSKGSVYYIMIFSRFIVGLSSSNATLCRSYIAQSTTMKERTSGIAIVSAAQSVGFVLGPTVQTILSLAIDAEPMKYQAAGYFAASLGVINFILLTPYIFEEFDISQKELSMMKGKGNGKDDQIELPKVDYLAISAILFAFFMNMFNYVLLETLMEPFLTDQYNWCDDIAVVVVGVSFGAAGILALGMFLNATRLSKIYDERKILLFGAFLLTTIGIFLFIPWGPNDLQVCYNETVAISNISKTYPDWCDEGKCYGCALMDQSWCDGYNQLPLAQFYVAFLFVMVGYPYGVSMGNAIYSKILGPRPQGLWMGILTASGSLARVMGPVFVSYVYATKGTTATFSILFAGMILAVIVLLLTYRRLVPMQIKVTKDERRT